jgi:hypothetical protein
MDQFFITLPSDSSSQYYPENTTACFKTKLSDRIDLDGEYEVGLAQLNYPHSWFNFNNKNEKYYMSYEPDDESEPVLCIFASGQFSNAKIMARVLSDSMSIGDINGAAFIWDPWKRKMVMTITNTRGSFRMSEALAEFLGYDGTQSYIVGNHIAERTFDLNRNLRLLYLYSDIVSYSLVGDTKAPLIRACFTEGEFGEMIQTTFTHPHYVPLSRTNFETIEININNELGKPMPFEFGKSVVTLHFRRKNKLLL